MLMVSTGLTQVEDRHHVGYKSYDASAGPCADLFNKLLKQYLKSIRLKLQRLPNIPSDKYIEKVMLCANHIITNRLRFNFALGEWVYQKGVSQVMQPHTSYWSYFSHMRKVVLHVGKDSRNQGLRQIHRSSFPFSCPVETSEGAQHVGVFNHLALNTTITPNIFQICMISDLIGCFLGPVSNYIDRIKK